MKTRKSYLGLFVMVVLLIGLFAGCGNKSAEEEAAADTTTDINTAADASVFSYSDGLDENGYWIGITAADYVDMTKPIEIPSEVGEISDEEVQSRIDEILADYTTTKEIKDRAVQDGDTVNIGYVGSIDGVAFDGGSTGDEGADVTIGVTSYIDDFLEQLIGHDPGETFDVNVTFPEDYQQADLAGKAAVFVTTVNFILETVAPEFDDAFVEDKLSAAYGWKTVAEMKAGVYDELHQAAIQNYFYEYLFGVTLIKPAPDALVEYQKKAMLKYYEDYAVAYGMTLEEFLNTYVGVSSEEELIEANAEGNLQSANFTLAVQSAAERAKLVPTDEDIAQYFKDQTGSDDYSEFEAEYGRPYLKQMVLIQKVLDYLADETAR